MNQIYITAIAIYILTIFIISRLTSSKIKNETGEKVWRIGGGKSGYWRILVVVSGLITAGVMLVLKYLVFSA